MYSSVAVRSNEVNFRLVGRNKKILGRFTFFRSVCSSLVQNKGLLYEEYLISTLMFRNMKSGGALLRFAIS